MNQHREIKASCNLSMGANFHCSVGVCINFRIDWRLKGAQLNLHFFWHLGQLAVKWVCRKIRTKYIKKLSPKSNYNKHYFHVTKS